MDFGKEAAVFEKDIKKRRKEGRKEEVIRNNVQAILFLLITRAVIIYPGLMGHHLKAVTLERSRHTKVDTSLKLNASAQQNVDR